MTNEGMTNSTDKIALITGASRGLGAALAEALAPTHHIIAVARTSGALEELDDRIKAKGGSATLAPLDICDQGAMQHLCRSVYDRWGHVDLWAHTAIHGAPLAPSGHVDPKDFDKSMTCNATAAQRLITYVEPLLLAAENGTALFFDDDAPGVRYFGSYGASKAAQMALVRSWRGETQSTGPRVVIAKPKPMPTGLRARFFPGEDRAPLASPHEEAKKALDLLQQP
ncbi:MULTISPECIES: SDR family NAD(P)-dependent oxidoreductase [Halocynthiibacter]|uniref:SDR family NAD(P)-dependent oxidoreductase n=1 Tax=Halocynthiibacter halioticoli TaxID=2986804 RepID=A0AAE3J0X0_9RHOB|nr:MULTISPECIES: SDR family NAD(P)-dependent oxidoreductase [Halocynthiibacter]MCV6824675.1 SDR family NAD(P)-dependent oxidoreductase [Halocynthiibacter halioticoli]MCW4057676.1 SDR family NAD(P)-dependent oxidoreductase [Halocynthiibacter sp. SDUM655004]MDE0589286.1 SDR family NAD(P)-dependent oxidoreductase [Halocynthiibacter sp. C4]